MLCKSLLIFSGLALAAVAGPAGACPDVVAGGFEPRADLNSPPDGYGTLPGRRSFYSYPRHRHIEGGVDNRSSFDQRLSGSYDGSPNNDRSHGSAYYGTNYGAPYHGGGYYDGGTYYRERRD